MKESHGKGPASHPDPESCVDGRKAGSEALTGAHAGQPSSCEIIHSGVPTLLSEVEGHTGIDATGKPISDPAQETRAVDFSNAIYFKGEWAEVFPIAATKDDDFLLGGGKKQRVPMMASPVQMGMS